MEKEICEKHPIRILNVVPNMRAAGIENFIMNIYRNIDKSKIQFDFLVHNEARNFFDDEIEKLGGKIYRFSFKDDKNIFKYIKDLISFFDNHKEYKIIHGHMQSMMPLYLGIAKYKGVPIRIAHAHNGSYEKTLKGFVLHLFSRCSKYYATKLWACSNVAGKYLFKNNNFEIFYNGIDGKRFKYDYVKRKEIRDELKIDDDTIVVGHIGRFELQKNHSFFINVIDDIVKKNNKCKILCVLIGEGKLKNKIVKIIKQKNILQYFKILNVRNDIENVYNAFDIFVLPSLYEGLPLVGVEAQLNGLPCVFSNKITKELKICENTSFVGLSQKQWSRCLLELINEIPDRNKQIKNTTFDLKDVVNKIQGRYIEYENEK